MSHLDEDGAVLSQQQVMDRLLGGQLSLFDDLLPAKAAKSRRRYRAVED